MNENDRDAGRSDSPPPMPAPAAAPSVPISAHRSPKEITLEREIKVLKDRLVREATGAIGMLEASVDALFRLDEPAARLVIQRDDEIDSEEVHIEEECFRLLALYQPFARDFRKITCMQRVNADLERVADHATSIAKQSIKIKKFGAARLPTALMELGQRVPMLCHTLLTSFITENVEGARSVILKDEDIDSLDKRLFDECIDSMTGDRNSRAAGLLMYRCGRELERVGDLMASIAEDVLYLVGGHIVRHEEKDRLKRG